MAVTSFFERLTDAQNSHDAQAMASLFAQDYQSEQPVHPSRAFTGNAQVLENWTGMFEGIPDFEARLLASSRTDDTEWAEFAWSGHHVDGSEFAMRGVIIGTVRDGLLAAARLYMEPVDHAEVDIAEAVDQLTRPDR